MSKTSKWDIAKELKIHHGKMLDHSRKAGWKKQLDVWGATRVDAKESTTSYFHLLNFTEVQQNGAISKAADHM